MFELKNKIKFALIMHKTILMSFKLCLVFGEFSSNYVWFSDYRSSLVDFENKS